MSFPLSAVTVATGFGATAAGLEKMQSGYRRLADKVCKMRCLGAAALDICNTSCGRLTAFFEKGLHHWDVAAGAMPQLPGSPRPAAPRHKRHEER